MYVNILYNLYDVNIWFFLLNVIIFQLNFVGAELLYMRPCLFVCISFYTHLFLLIAQLPQILNNRRYSFYYSYQRKFVDSNCDIEQKTTFLSLSFNHFFDIQRLISIQSGFIIIFIYIYTSILLSYLLLWTLVVLVSIGVLDPIVDSGSGSSNPVFLPVIDLYR